MVKVHRYTWYRWHTWYTGDGKGRTLRQEIAASCCVLTVIWFLHPVRPVRYTGTWYNVPGTLYTWYTWIWFLRPVRPTGAIILIPSSFLITLIHLVSHAENGSCGSSTAINVTS